MGSQTAKEVNTKPVINKIEEVKIHTTVPIETDKIKLCSKCGREIILKQGKDHPYWWHTDGNGSCSKVIKREKVLSTNKDSITTICHTCNKEVNLRWSKNGKPYWKHLIEEDCIPSSNESITHRFAKEELTRKINNKEVITMLTTCQRCSSVHEDNISKNVVKAQVEYKYNNINGEKAIFDIACLNVEGKISFGIEIFYKHETDNKMARMGVKWYEVLAVDVLRSVGENNIKLTNNIKLINCDNLSCMSLSETALKLGYLEEPISENEALALINFVSDRSWKMYSDINPNLKLDIWESFVNRKCCLKCGRSENTKIKKPYCVECYKQINQDKINASAIKQKLKWLNNVPQWDGKDKSCYYCSKTYINVEDNIYLEKFWGSNNKVAVKLKYDGFKLRCCTVCLYEKLKRQGIKL